MFSFSQKGFYFLEIDTAISKGEMTECLHLLQNDTGGSKLEEEAYRLNRMNHELTTAEANDKYMVALYTHGALT